MSDELNADYVIANIPLTGPGAGYWGYTPVPSWAVYDAIAVLNRQSLGLARRDASLPLRPGQASVALAARTWRGRAVPLLDSGRSSSRCLAPV